MSAPRVRYTKTSDGVSIAYWTMWLSWVGAASEDAGIAVDTVGYLGGASRPKPHLRMGCCPIDEWGPRH